MSSNELQSELLQAFEGMRHVVKNEWTLAATDINMYHVHFNQLERISASWACCLNALRYINVNTCDSSTLRCVACVSASVADNVSKA